MFFIVRESRCSTPVGVTGVRQTGCPGRFSNGLHDFQLEQMTNVMSFFFVMNGHNFNETAGILAFPSP
jgi:hypothetical protein